MSITLETLLLTPEERDERREVIRRMAYFHWQDAGCPATDGRAFWERAEQEWIANCYVPHRGSELAATRRECECKNDCKRCSKETKSVPAA